MLGAPVDEPSWMFGDNMSTVISGTLPSSTLKKRWNALSYHKVREAAASKIMNLIHLPGEENPADVLTKNLPHNKLYYLMKEFIFQPTRPKPSSDCNVGSVNN